MIGYVLAQLQWSIQLQRRSQRLSHCGLIYVTRSTSEISVSLMTSLFIERACEKSPGKDVVFWIAEKSIMPGSQI